MKNLTLIIAVVAIVVAGGVATYTFLKPETCSGQCGAKVMPEHIKNMPSPEPSALSAITLEDFSGKEHSIVSGREVTVINSWATWCAFCTKELPDFEELQKEFGNQIAVVIVNRSEDQSKAEAKLNEIGLADSAMLSLLDPSNIFYTTIGGFTSPETVFTDSNGKILFHKRGPMTLSEMRSIVTEKLQEASTK